MSEREDVEALVDWVVRWLYNGPDGHRGPPPPRESLVDLECDARNAIEAVLASSWLAAHDEAVRVSERVRLAGEVGAPECDHPGIEHGQFSYTGICPTCHKCKWIGHGPLCGDCYRAPGVRLTEEE